MFRSFLGALLFSLTLSTGAIAQTCSIPNNLTNGTNADATQVMANFNALLNCINTTPPPPASTPLRSYLGGLTLSTAGGSTSFAVAVGIATSDDTTTSMKLSASLSKTTGAWAVGSGNGSLDTGTIASNTWYHVYLIERTDTSVVDVLISLSASAPTLPTSYSVKRRIGSMKTNSSTQWTAFVQNGDEFLWVTPVNDISVSNLGTTATLYPLSVPSGLQVWARMRGYFENTTAANFLINSPDENSTAANSPAGNDTASGTVAIYGELLVRTNTSAQIRAVSSLASTTLNEATFGWIDRRGRDN